MWTIRVTLGYYLGIVLGYGVLGIAACLGIECVVKTLVFGFRFRGEAWLNKKTIEE